MRYLLDTNIISNITKPIPSESLLAWMSKQVDEDLFIASLTVAEIRRGVLEQPAGKRREVEAHKHALAMIALNQKPISPGPIPRIK